MLTLQMNIDNFPATERLWFPADRTSPADEQWAAAFWYLATWTPWFSLMAEDDRFVMIPRPSAKTFSYEHNLHRNEPKTYKSYIWKKYYGYSIVADKGGRSKVGD